MLNIRSPSFKWVAIRVPNFDKLESFSSVHLKTKSNKQKSASIYLSAFDLQGDKIILFRQMTIEISNIPILLTEKCPNVKILSRREK